jgi:hypothetical protein
LNRSGRAKVDEALLRFRLGKLGDRFRLLGKLLRITLMNRAVTATRSPQKAGQNLQIAPRALA